MQTALNFDADRPTRNFLTVSQITAKVKGLLETDIGEVLVKGEISGYRPSPSGHLYFSLKDSGAVISCAMFGARSRVKFDLKDGVEVVAHGKISVYAPRGNYQLIVDRLDPVGHGALQLAFEQLKAKLQKEGLFDASRKKELPSFPQKVVIITSPTGAALQDMLNVLGRRNAGISILVVPTLVQGDQAPAQIVRALEVVGKYRLGDVVVVARGGGSMEDLWCFNDEAVVRAIAACPIPIISAIGHEVDFTLSDFVADLRAPTPSAAAELVSKNRLELLETLLSNQRRLALGMSNRLGRTRSSLLSLENRLVSPTERLMRSRKVLAELELRMGHSIEGRLPTYRQMIDDLFTKMAHLSEMQTSDRRRKLENFSARLESLSPLKVLGRGYTLVQDTGSERLLKSARNTKPGDAVTLIFHDGKANATIV